MDDSELGGFYAQFKDIDELLYKYGVDIYLTGHKHNFQLIKPVYRNMSMSYETGGRSDLIRNPKAPIPIILGNAGCAEMIDDYEIWKKRECEDPIQKRKNIIN